MASEISYNVSVKALGSVVVIMLITAGSSSEVILEEDLTTLYNQRLKRFASGDKSVEPLEFRINFQNGSVNIRILLPSSPQKILERLM